MALFIVTAKIKSEDRPMASVTSLSGVSEYIEPQSSIGRDVVQSRAREVLRLLSQRTFAKNTSEIKEFFASNDSEGMRCLVESIAKETCDQLESFDPIEIFEKVADHLTREQVEQLIEAVQCNKAELFSHAKKYLEQARFYNSKVSGDEIPKTVVSRINSIIYALDALIDTLINAFALSDIFSHPENEMQASFRFQKMILLTSFLPTITALLAPLMGVSVSSALVTLAVVATIIGVSVAYGRYLRPISRSLPFAQNLTQMAQEGKFRSVEERVLYNDLIALALKTDETLAKRPLLIGPKGVGKTEIVKGFAQAVARGDYPDLKDKKVFYIQTQDLVNAEKSTSGYYKLLSSISSVMGRHRENIILVFDRIDKACQNEFERTLSNFLEQGKTSFPYVIGLADSDSYKEKMCAEFPGFGALFDQIQVTKASVEEMGGLLQSLRLKTAPEIKLCVTGSSFCDISRKFFPEAMEPQISFDLLRLCIKEVKQVSEEKVLIPEIKEMMRARDRIASLASSRKAVEDDVYSQLESSKEAIDEALKKKRERESISSRFISVSKRVASLTIHLFEKSFGIDPFEKREHQAKCVHLLRLYLLPVLEDKLMYPKTDDGGSYGLGSHKQPYAITYGMLERVAEREKQRRLSS